MSGVHEQKFDDNRCKKKENETMEYISGHGKHHDLNY
jgi:hypothetical protein